jgi:cbb3-type cytochrome oxidase subunit 3
VRWGVLTLSVLAAWGSPASSQAQDPLPASGVRVGATVQPNPVGVGEPVTLTVRVQVAAGVVVRFPGAMDSTDRVEPLDPVVVRETTMADQRELTATYRFVAWRTGAVPIPLAPIEIDRAGRVQRLGLGDPRVEVRSVLPADSAARVPQPARDILRPPADWWWLAWLAAVLLAVALLLWWAWRRRRRDRPRPASPARDALAACDALQALALCASGEPGRHAIAAAAILRTYLERREPAAAAGLTTRELHAVLLHDAAVPDFRVTAVLDAVDRIQFAGADVTAATALGLGEEVRAIITEVQRVTREREAAR